MSPSSCLAQMPYAGLSERLHDRVVAGRIPVDGTLELTYRCNLACLQCYCNLQAADPEAMARELKTPEVLRILDEIAEAGCLWLLLTGGEILLRRDFLEIYAHAKRKGLFLTLFTNGIGLTDRIADELAAEPPFALEITLYGATEATYRRVTGMAGGFARMMDGIGRAQARGLPLSLKATVLAENAHELEAMRALARDRGLAFHYSAELTPRTDRPGSPAVSRLSPEEVLALDRADPARWEELRALFTVTDRSRLANKSAGLFICQAGITGFQVNPYGRLLFCPSIEELGWDLRTLPFREAWRRFDRVRRMEAPRERACNDCDLNIACGTCAGSAHLEHGDRTRGVEFLHELTRLRAEAFGLKLKENEKGALVFDD